MLRRNGRKSFTLTPTKSELRTRKTQINKRSMILVGWGGWREKRFFLLFYKQLTQQFLSNLGFQITLMDFLLLTFGWCAYISDYKQPSGPLKTYQHKLPKDNQILQIELRSGGKKSNVFYFQIRRGGQVSVCLIKTKCHLSRESIRSCKTPIY